MTFHARGLSPEQVAQAVRDATGGGIHVSIDALGRGFTVNQSIHSLRKHGRHVQLGLTFAGGARPSRSTTSSPGSGRWWGRRAIRTPTTTSLLLVARGKLNPARLVTRQIALGDVTDTLQRMTRFETVGFEVVTRYA